MFTHGTGTGLACGTEVPLSSCLTDTGTTFWVQSPPSALPATMISNRYQFLPTKQDSGVFFSHHLGQDHPFLHKQTKPSRNSTRTGGRHGQKCLNFLFQAGGDPAASFYRCISKNRKVLLTTLPRSPATKGSSFPWHNSLHKEGIARFHGMFTLNCDKISLRSQTAACERAELCVTARAG